ncbi:MAG TPA: hypothetical protein VMQ44_03640 [Candidatus Saccharimonadales bacterium]|nr:hypothetical protein [Candidatus Saccharimonadales bacterium]
MAKRDELEFSAKEFPHHEKNHLWYFGIGLIVVAAIVITLKYHNYLLAAVAVAAGLAAFSLARVTPSTHSIKLTPKGVYFGKDFFPYHKLRAFWLALAGEHTTVYLERLNFSSMISFVIPESRADEVLEYLLNFLPWHEHKGEPIPDRLSRFLKL